MIDLETWLNTYREAVLAAFGARVRFIGLQGSRARGEARAESDIDMVLILDRLEMEDLQRYRALGARLPDAALLCGFVTGAEAALGGACPACEPATRLLMEWAGTHIRQTAEPAAQE